jgi:4-hydroxybutyrate CoA-transferase
MPSTALDGGVSNIVPRFEEGQIVTVPREISDTVVTEFGIARLLGKTVRQRAEELIAVAHPDFRAELRNAAKSFFYPAGYEAGPAE